MQQDAIEDELIRYIAYLQASNLTDGWNAAHDSEQITRWFSENRGKLATIAQDTGLDNTKIDEIERALGQFNPRTKFDSPISRAIFEPLLEMILAESEKLGCAPERPVIFANHTDISASAGAIPSSGEHIIFAGVGTYCFCNYWAKALAAISYKYRTMFQGCNFDSENLKQLWSKHPELILVPARLVLFCHTFGSLVGFGSLRVASEYNAYRIQILRALELFAIGHEVGHCVIEEKFPNRQINPRDEFICDQYSIGLSRSISSKEDDWLLFSGAGAYAFLRAAAISIPEDSMHVTSQPQSHPTPTERANAIKSDVISKTVDDQRDAVLAYLSDYECLFNELDVVIKESIKSIGSDSIDR